MIFLLFYLFGKSHRQYHITVKSKDGMHVNSYTFNLSSVGLFREWDASAIMDHIDGLIRKQINYEYTVVSLIRL